MVVFVCVGQAQVLGTYEHLIHKFLRDRVFKKLKVFVQNCLTLRGQGLSISQLGHEASLFVSKSVHATELEHL